MPMAHGAHTYVTRGGRLLDAVSAAEREIIEATLIQCRWHKKKTARALGIHYKTLFNKMRRHGIMTVDDEEAAPCLSR